MGRTQATGLADPAPESRPVSAAPKMRIAEVSPNPPNLLPEVDLVSMPVDAAAPPIAIRSPHEGRAFDVVMAMFLLFLVFPLMCVTALVVLRTSRGPLLFRQPR